MQAHRVRHLQLVQAGLRAGRQSAEITAKLRQLRVAQECEYGPLKQRLKKGVWPPPDGRSLQQLRWDEHDTYDRHKLQLRRDLERCMQLASDRERARELEDIARRLESLRQPEAGLSRKQLKVVNGALLAVAEALHGSVASPLQEEVVMMRRVAKRHNHGLNACEEANEHHASTMAKTLDPEFVPSASFSGKRPGYSFKSGPQGVGYYRDENTVI